jgi:hypothetical protein
MSVLCYDGARFKIKAKWQRHMVTCEGAVRFSNRSSLNLCWLRCIAAFCAG